MSTVAAPTPTITPEVLDDSSAQLVKFVKDAKLESQSGELVLATFKPLLARANEWKIKIDELIPKDREPTKEECATIKRTRLDLVKVRTGAEKEKKRLKADALAFGKAVDGAYNQLEALTTPLEEKLKAAEEFAERREAERKAKLKSDRETAIAPYGLDITFYNFGEMSQEAFDQILSMAKMAQEGRIAAEKKAAEEKAAKEKAEAEERERIRLENERLKAEAAERDRLAAEQRAKDEAARKAQEEVAKAELKRRTDQHDSRLAAIKSYLSPVEVTSTPPLFYADMTDEQFGEITRERKRQYDEAVRLAEERRKADEKARKEREAAEAKARVEREAREKAEAEARRLKEQVEAEAKRKRDEEEAAKKAAELAVKRAAAAPDKTKLVEFAKAIRALPVPQLKTAATLGMTIRQQVEKFAAWVEKQAETF